MYRKLLILALVVCVFPWAVAAQDQAKVPKLLVLEREEIKPGKVNAHAQAAARYVQIVEKNQANIYRIGGLALAGNTNEIFYFGFADSYADYERTNDFSQNMVADLASLESQTGDVHQSQRSIIAEFVPDLSYRPEVHLAALNTAKRVTVSVVRTRPGTRRDLEEVEKMFIDAHKKAGINDEYWLAYSVEAGMPSGTFIFIEASPSLSNWDHDHSKQIREIIGEEALKKARAVEKEAVIFEETSIVSVDPKVSRPTKEMVAANPSWWSAKPQATMAQTKTKKQ